MEGNKKTVLAVVLMGILIVGVTGCGGNQEVSDNKETSVNSTNNLQNMVQKVIDFEHVTQVALNNNDNVISDKSVLSKLGEILNEMQLEEIVKYENEDQKLGFQQLIFTYEDGSNKKLCISANKVATIDKLSYSIVNQSEIADKIARLYDKYAR